MTDPNRPEPFLPKISLRWLIGLVTVCACAMGVIQQAISTGSQWAVLATVVIASIAMPVLMYVATFALASLFSTIGSAAVGLESPAKIYVPTTKMPDTPSAATSAVATTPRPAIELPHDGQPLSEPDPGIPS
ncbi:MAG: hypothetical protein KDB00_28915 [Planctomycetales bacterium]|nr:hypothetical protein [Planctomycetales bacterium]